jgi:phosphohistidine phosphatase
MEIYLLRHGIAEDGRAGTKDAERRLTAEGKKKLRAVLKRAQLAGAAPELILTSPYVRARQTAEIAQAVLAPDALVAETRALTPMARAEEAWEEIRIYGDRAQVLCASHEPLCGVLAGYLLRSPALEIDFKKGALMRVDVESAAPRPRGTLKWMLCPKLA